MSTKIYNGIKFKSNDMKEILQQLQNVRKEALKICNDLITNVNIEDYLLYKFNKIDLANKSSHEINKIMSNDIMINDEAANLFLDFKCSIFIIPHEDGNVYGGQFCSGVESYKELLKPYIEEYHYQNQTDKPDNISDDEWNERDEIWENIFKNFWTFPEVGFGYEIVKASDLHLYSRIKKVMNIILKVS